MCDYSLMSFPNRLASCGEELVVYRFQSGSVGLAAAEELSQFSNNNQGWWQRLWTHLSQHLNITDGQRCIAVCVPPGARLLVRDLPAKLQRSFDLHDVVQEVVFTEIDTTGFRDAIRFDNGTEVLLQNLKEGQRVRVLALSSEVPEISRPLFAGA